MPRFLPVIAAAALLFAVSPIARSQPPVSPVAGPQPALRLFGVVVRNAGGTALLAVGDGRAEPLRVGESRSGYTLVEVAPDGVVLRDGAGALFRVRFPEAASAPALEAGEDLLLPAPPIAEAREVPEVPAPVAPAAAPAEAPGDVVRRFSRDEVRLRLATELPRILSGAVVAPRVRGNEVEGLELVSFPTDTLLGETGLAAGDVLMEVNGREVRGMESLAILAQRFQTARELELRVDRAGEVFSLRYFIE